MGALLVAALALGSLSACGAATPQGSDADADLDADGTEDADEPVDAEADGDGDADEDPDVEQDADADEDAEAEGYCAASEGSGSAVVVGVDACSPIAAALWVPASADGEDPEVVTSSHERCCDLERLAELTIRAAAVAADAAQEEARLANDGLAGCEAELEELTATVDLLDAQNPPGSCSIVLLLDSAAPGDYTALGADGHGFRGFLYYVSGSHHALVEALDGCRGVTDWGSWLSRQTLIDAAWQSIESALVMTDGTATVSGPADAPVVHAVSVGVASYDGPERGTIDFDLEPQLCAP